MPHVILNREDLADAVAYFKQHDAFTFDVETVGAFRGVPSQNQITWLSMATHGAAVAIPMGHPNGDVLISRATRKKNRDTGKFTPIPAVWDEPPPQLRPGQVFEALQPLLFGEQYRKIAHNAVFDLVSVAKYYDGQLPVPKYGCTLVGSWLLDENRLNGLKPRVVDQYGHKYDTENVGRQVEIHSFSKVARYAVLDARYTWLLWKRMVPLLQAEGLSRAMSLELQVLETLLDMALTGAPVDLDALHALDATLTVEVARIIEEVYKAAGQVFNINSTKQKADVLFGKKAAGGQGIKPSKLTKGGRTKKREGTKPTIYDYSTDAEELKKHDNNKVCATLLEYQEVNKLLGTYVHGYLGDEAEGKPSIIFNGRIYPTFKQYGTVSGRFSASEPNLQNVPAPSSPLGAAVRGLFVAPQEKVTVTQNEESVELGWKLLIADYGQIELRVMAHFLGYGAWYDGFFAGIDAHTATASAVFGVRPDDVTKDQRNDSKTLAFATLFGAQAATVAKAMHSTVPQAQAFLDLQARKMPEVGKFQNWLIREALKHEIPHIRTLVGRKRRLPDLASPVDWIREKAERQLLNSLIQGSAADLNKMAIIRMGHLCRLNKDWLRLSLTVHDELVVHCREDKAEEGSSLLQTAMIGPGIQEVLKVPITADVKVCDRWSEAK
ncbi:DNA polymerase [Streptomyces sp. H27-C3]|uniref:DNA polymerase n=1 Tax=Streptomyces sp. H27-C3 TaxID=3046305 RepID=UPI0024B96817|nr:DNA polymerase [Streptomyces sp. H27-C3]MDJ0463162.1 DNA polymerase [Streptomyces sp. H27-C3]